MHRALIPPLTIALALLTAGTLLVTAVAIVPPPLVDAVPSPASPTAATATSSPATDAVPLAMDTNTLVVSSGATLPPPPVVVDLARLTYAPGSGGSSRALPGQLLLAVESGTLTVHLDGAGQLLQQDQPAVRAQGRLTLDAGDGLVLPAATAAAFRNEESVPVVALGVGLFPAAVARGPASVGLPQGHTAPARWADDASPGASAQPLAGGWLVDSAGGPVAVELRRMSLPPQGKAAWSGDGAAVLAVETGALTLTVGQGLAWQQPPDGPDAWIAPASAATLLPGDGALLQDRPRITLRNDGSGPLLLLMLTVTPAERATPPSGMP